MFSTSSISVQNPHMIRNEPTYSGLRTRAYGPIVVSSRFFRKRPADHERMPRPAKMIMQPATATGSR